MCLTYLLFKAFYKVKVRSSQRKCSIQTNCYTNKSSSYLLNTYEYQIFNSCKVASLQQYNNSNDEVTKYGSSTNVTKITHPRLSTIYRLSYSINILTWSVIPHHVFSRIFKSFWYFILEESRLGKGYGKAWVVRNRTFQGQPPQGIRKHERNFWKYMI